MSESEPESSDIPEPTKEEFYTAPEPPPAIESSVWRLGPGGPTITSVVERHAGSMAQRDTESIYFYADLEGSSALKYDEETMMKVHRALSQVGLSETQIINAVNGMQNSGILFRESAL